MCNVDWCRLESVISVLWLFLDFLEHTLYLSAASQTEPNKLNQVREWVSVST